MHRFFKYFSFIKCVTTFPREIPEEQKCNNYYTINTVYVGNFGNREYVRTSGDNHEKNAAAKWIRICRLKCIFSWFFMSSTRSAFISLNSLAIVSARGCKRFVKRLTNIKTFFPCILFYRFVICNARFLALVWLRLICETYWQFRL